MNKKTHSEKQKEVILSRCEACGMFYEAGNKHECPSASDFDEMICPMCGKTFYPPSPNEWVYRRSGFVFCSWHCTCAFDRTLIGRELMIRQAHPRRPSRISKKERENRDKIIYKKYKAGSSALELSVKFGMTAEHIRKIIRKIERGEDNSKE